MSHIAVDLKVIEVLAPGVARSAGISEDRSLAGLVRLWHRCWSTKATTITKAGVAAVFGAEQVAEIIEALVDARFLEVAREGWRVKGAEKYLRISEARSRGGKAASGNLRRGTRQPGGSSGSSPADSRLEPGSVPGSSPALTPSTEHRAPLKEDPETLARSVPQLELVGQKSKSRPPPKPPDPEAEFARFTQALTPDEASVFEAYETHMGLRLGADWGLRKFVGQRLKAHHAAELCAAIKGHAADAWKREHSPSLRAILRDATVIAAAAKAGAA